MSLIGKEIQDFKTQAFIKDEFKEITKQDLLGKWNVFFFYPADFTFVCPTELEDLANKYNEFKNINCEIYSVSCDTHFVHKAWHDTSKTIKKIQYPMLADPTATLAKDFDVYIEADGLAERGTFIINPEGKIVAYEVIAGNVGRNADELLRRVQASQFVYEHGDEVCPAKWKPGEKNIKTLFRFSRNDLMNQVYDVIIVGGGPAGLSSAIYLTRAKYSVLVIEKEKFGGQITITSEIVNYPGVMEDSGEGLTLKMKKTSTKFWC